MFLSVYRGWFIGLSSLVYRFIGFGLSVYRVWFIGLSGYRFIGLSGMGLSVYRFIGLSVYRFIGLSVYRVWVYRFIGYIMQVYIYIYVVHILQDPGFAKLADLRQVVQELSQ